MLSLSCLDLGHLLKVITRACRGTGGGGAGSGSGQQQVLCPSLRLLALVEVGVRRLRNALLGSSRIGQKGLGILRDWLGTPADPRVAGTSPCSSPTRGSPLL